MHQKESKPAPRTMGKISFFTECGEASRYRVHEVIGQGSYGLVCSAVDTHTGEWVAIKKIHDIFDHISDATRILREIKLLRFLRHPDIVQLKHILLPPSPLQFKDVFVVFELMESDLHHVIKTNDDLTREHFRFFLYQLLRALKFLHTANVFHRDLKPKNVLANSDCKLKICDFGLARVTFNGSSSAIFWSDYVATRWYRAPELCGSFTAKYTTAIDVWSIGCIFAEVLIGRPLFPGKNIIHQLDLITDLVGTPSLDVIARIRNEKARRYLSGMRKKHPIPFHRKFPHIDPLAARLLQRLLAFDAKDRPSAEEALNDPYFRGLAKLEREPTSPPATRAEFEFDRQHLTKDDVREMIYREILEYHPQVLKQYLTHRERPKIICPSAVNQLRRQFDSLHKQSKENLKLPLERRLITLPSDHWVEVHDETRRQANVVPRCLQEKNCHSGVPKGPHNNLRGETLQNNKVTVSNVSRRADAHNSTSYVKKLIKSASLGMSQQNCVTQPHAKACVLLKIEDDKKGGIRSKSKSMGVSVAKMVAAFSNGLAQS